MKEAYAQALLELLKSGMPVDEALSSFRSLLSRRHHEKLLAPVLHEVLRTLEADRGVNVATVSVAKEQDVLALTLPIQSALKTLGVDTDTEVKTIVDDTLIGGFVASYNDQEHDQSYKKALITLYESVTK